MLMDSALGMGGLIVEGNKNGDGGRDFDESLRVEVRRGCELVHEMEQMMKLVPVGCLRLQSYSQNETVRASLMGTAAAIVTTFSNVITLFNSTSTEVPLKREDRPIGSFLREDHLQEDKIDGRKENSSSPMGSSAKRRGSPTPGTPPPASQNSMKESDNLLHSSPTRSITPTFPQSPTNRILPAKRSTPSPQQRIHDTAPADKLSKPNDRAELPTPLDLNDTNGKSTTSIQAKSSLKTDNLEIDTEGQYSILKKRKCLPNGTLQIQGSNSSEQGHEASPEDGYTWRKYGQKDILRSRHPRSYYRCTRKLDLGCPAIKYVQKSDDDQFLVTYRGAHTCHSHIYISRPCPFLQDLQPNSHVNSSCLTLNSSGALHVGECGLTFSSTKEGLPFGPSLFLSKSTKTTGMSLPPLSTLPLPDQNLGTVMFQSKLRNASASCQGSNFIDGFDPMGMMTISHAKTSQIQQTNNTMLTHSFNVPTHEAGNTHNLVISDMSRDVSESFKQLINHLCLDDTDTYDSSADQENSDCPPLHFAPTNSEVVSSPLPLESSLQRSSCKSNPIATVDSFDLKDLQAPTEPEKVEEVAQHIPSSKFEIDSVFGSPRSQQQLLDLQSLLFDP